MNAIANILREAADKIAALELPAPFRIELGKRYVRRDGSISGKIQHYSSLPNPHKFFDGKYHYMPDGHGFSDLQDNDIDLVREYVEPAPALPAPPEGFHKAMMGPVKGCGNSGDYIPGIAIFDAYRSGEWCTKDDWSGDQPKRIYALRIGSDIARLNGLELTLELGRTYATNSGEIVNPDFTSDLEPGDAWGDSSKPNLWNSIGQALIDGIAQPLSHPDSIREEIPAELLPLPALPSGFKELRWRGFGWATNHDVQFYFFEPANCWLGGPSMSQKAKGKSGYYLEAIPADKEPEPVKRREWTLHRHELNDFARIVDSSPFPHSKRIRVREVLPGDPTMEQVDALVRTLQNAFTFRVTNHPTWEAEARKALQPFTGKEPK